MRLPTMGLVLFWTRTRLPALHLQAMALCRGTINNSNNSNNSITPKGSTNGIMMKVLLILITR
jgi:hypothetical protein